MAAGSLAVIILFSRLLKKSVSWNGFPLHGFGSLVFGRYLRTWRCPFPFFILSRPAA
jgi:hypothetical protein